MLSLSLVLFILNHFYAIFSPYVWSLYLVTEVRLPAQPVSCSLIFQAAIWISYFLLFLLNKLHGFSKKATWLLCLASGMKRFPLILYLLTQQNFSIVGVCVCLVRLCVCVWERMRGRACMILWSILHSVCVCLCILQCVCMCECACFNVCVYISVC